ncbi:hypothetical protein ACHQM5_015337 [Ranunculus cassubicifolius]
MASSSVVVMLIISVISSFLLSVSPSGHNNPADQLVALVNAERATKKLPAFEESPMLSCLAGTYATSLTSLEGNCKKDNVPRVEKVNFTSKSKCNINDVKSVDSITICQRAYDTPAKVIKYLGNTSDSVNILSSTTHKEVGAVITGTDGGAPYYWNLMFDAGNSTSLAVGSVPPGCYAGTGLGCSDAPMSIGQNLVSYVIRSLVFFILLL